ncbi:MAG: hypothetical protein BroJett013_04740 [Alphaproteobacteria bacterium]|nr:MAG: hypothetical protein BroJett013_04740 [Alphaproteobacteria bacterium]
MTYAVSAAGLTLIQEHEGFRAAPAQTPDGGWVVGYGHARLSAPGEPVSRDEAAELLAKDVAPVARVVNALVTAPLTQSQFDALVSFAFSIGLDAFADSQVLRRLNSGDLVAAACALDAWRKAKIDEEVEVSDALVRRRAAEKAMLLKDAPFEVAPSAMLRPRLDHAASILGAPVRAAVAAANTQPSAQIVSFSSATAVMTQPQPDAPAPDFVPAVCIADVMKSEPQDDVLLLTQVANDCDDAEAEPVVPAREAQAAEKSRFRRLKRGAISGLKRALEHCGLAALMILGLALIALGASLMFSGEGAGVEIAAAAAVATPGLAATLMAAYGFWRTPRASAAA